MESDPIDGTQFDEVELDSVVDMQVPLEGQGELADIVVHHQFEDEVEIADMVQGSDKSDLAGITSPTEISSTSPVSTTSVVEGATPAGTKGLLGSISTKLVPSWLGWRNRISANSVGDHSVSVGSRMEQVSQDREGLATHPIAVRSSRGSGIPARPLRAADVPVGGQSVQSSGSVQSRMLVAGSVQSGLSGSTAAQPAVGTLLGHPTELGQELHHGYFAGGINPSSSGVLGTDHTYITSSYRDPVVSPACMGVMHPQNPSFVLPGHVMLSGGGLGQHIFVCR